MERRHNFLTFSLIASSEFKRDPNCCKNLKNCVHKLKLPTDIPNGDRARNEHTESGDMEMVFRNVL